MKKVFLVVTAVLLAALMAGCDNSVEPKVSESVVSYDEEGRELVEVSVGVDEESARSLLPSVAQDYATYYEVVFQNGAGTAASDFRRVSWKGISNAKIKLWSLDYDNNTATDHGTAVLFAGTQTDRTLLGVGKIDNTYNNAGAPTGTTVSARTTRIVFKVVALDARIYQANTTANPSAFKITGGGSGTTSTAANTALPVVQAAGINIPVFLVGKNDATIAASYTLGLWDVSGNTVAAWADYNPLIKVRATGNVTFSAASIGGYRSVSLTDAGFAATLTAATTAANGSLPNVLPIEIKSPDKDGMCEIAFEVPVSALAPISLTKSPELWMIRGGINSGDYDDGSADPATGGMNSIILIGVGEYDAPLDDGITIGSDF